MDLRNLCSKFDVDAIRAKIPPLPPLPQIKLPKSMSKLKSRKIFRSSREDVNAISRRASSKYIPPAKADNSTLPLGPPLPEFINRTPTRISTISSLMRKRGGETASKWTTHHEDEENSYRSAGSIDDFYPSPMSQRFEQHISRPISPVKAPPIVQEFQVQSEQNIKMSFTEKLQKGYKDVTEFKLKHLFSKRTVVHKDNIQVNEYVHRYDEDRRHEQRVQENFDRDISDNYRFQFKVSKQDSEESYGNSPIGSSQNQEIQKAPKHLSELSGDESGMESSPPPRKPGIASTRFARVRKTPLSMSLEEDNQNSDRDDMENIELDEQDVSDTPNRQPNKSSLYSIKKRISPSKSTEKLQSPLKSKSFKERIGRLTKHNSEGDVFRVASEKKRKAPLNPQQSLEETKENEDPAQGKSEKPLNAIKHNFKRLQKSIKLPQSMQATAESENEETNPESKAKISKAQHFAERLKRFRSTDHMDKNPDDDGSNESPMHKITNKLQEWKKSFKKKPENHQTDIDEDDEATSPQKPDKPVGSLMKRIKHIRSRRHESIDDPDEDEEGGDTYKESLAARAKLQLEKGVVAASLVPQRTIKKISETKKYFKKKPETDNKNKSDKSKSDDEDEDVQPTTSKPPAKVMPSRPPPPIPRPFYHYSSDEEGTETREEFIKKSIIEAKQIQVPAARTTWTTKPILSDDTTDYDDELPRVLIHQDNSDIFESTLIIAVTRPRSHTTTPIITELPPDSAEESTPDTKPDNWIPNRDMAATFMDMSPPSQGKLYKHSNGTSSFKDDSRKHSIDSSSEDSWIKDIPRGPSIAVLNSFNENDEPWKVRKCNKEEKMYKTKSIDLFEMQKKHGGVLTAFEDFDDELKNTPVVKIEEQESDKSEERTEQEESSNELNNPVNVKSSKITNEVDLKESKEAKLKSKSYGNSQESLTGNLDHKEPIDSGEEDDNEASECDGEDNYDEDDENEDDDNELDRPPSKEPSPPPSISPPPPPLPQRQPSVRLSKISTLSQSFEEMACPLDPPPPLPLTKPPLPPNRPVPPPPPKIPERNASTIRNSKPLVKTASLRLAYDEQVNPEDIGKVNKLISQFEPDGPKQIPRIIPRKPLISNDSEDYSEDEEDSIEIPTNRTTILHRFRDTTPTNHPKMQKSFSIDSADIPPNNNTTTPISETTSLPPIKATSQTILGNRGSSLSIPSISISTSCQDVNSNFSQPSSVYGSPLPYPSSLVSSTEATPLMIRKDSEQLKTRRNRCSLVRDDENFYSFDSDEENSYYSIGSNSSNRYVVEL